MAKGESGHDHHHHHHHGSQDSLLCFALNYVVKSWQAGFSEARWLSLFALFITCLGALEVVQGVWTGVFHLITEGFHSVLHAVCVTTAVLAMGYSRLHQLPDSKSSYGSDRAEIITAFSNGVFLIFIAVFAIMEGSHTIWDEPLNVEPITANPILLLRSITELVIFMRIAHYLDRKEVMTPTQQNLGVLSLHIAGMLVSDVISMGCELYGLHQHTGPLRLVEPVANIVWYLWAISSVIPYISHNGKLLLLCSPQGKARAALTKALRDVSFIEGVVAIRQQYFWLRTDSCVVGSLVLCVHHDANTSAVVTKCHSMLGALVENLTVQVETEALASNKET